MVFSAEDRIKVWPANSPDLNPVDYRILGELQEHVYRNWIRDADQLKSCLIEEWEQFQQSVINEAVKQWHKPAFEHVEDISNKNFVQAYCSIFL